jgi:hypothetical protein
MHHVALVVWIRPDSALGDTSIEFIRAILVDILITGACTQDSLGLDFVAFWFGGSTLHRFVAIERIGWPVRLRMRSIGRNIYLLKKSCPNLNQDRVLMNRFLIPLLTVIVFLHKNYTLTSTVSTWPNLWIIWDTTRIKSPPYHLWF